jgi:hypothetical protein
MLPGEIDAGFAILGLKDLPAVLLQECREDWPHGGVIFNQ